MGGVSAGAHGGRGDRCGDRAPRISPAPGSSAHSWSAPRLPLACKPGRTAVADALDHAALNIANAAGAWLGGLVIAAGFGYTALSLVGAVLAAKGVLLLTATVWAAR
ncbi:hypothetical protein [Nocardia pneumoniae]|uniref:hypothetical protein n=1 Tax=Nocardia pneumoniae TaxID=228601 RepID=UPI002479276F|nr:hypothetical protein [Nocardia pneumoniae]